MKIEKQWENNRSKMISNIVFGAYLFLLTWLVLFKFAFTIEEIPHLRQLNLIPFHYETSVAFITHMKEVIYLFRQEFTSLHFWGKENGGWGLEHHFL